MALQFFKPYVDFGKKYERHIAVAALLVGFVFDTLTLGRPDQIFGNSVLIAYLFISAGSILYLVTYGSRKKSPILPLVLLQFSFGNLAGGLLVLYGQSGTFEGSIFFFLLFGAFIVGNEFARQYYAKANFHIAAWYFLLLAYCALIVPVLLEQFGDAVFVGSSALSVLIVSGFMFLLYKLSPLSFAGLKRQISATLISILVLFNALYFLNIIPPVPLSLQEIGVYHSVSRTQEGDYRVEYENPRWYEFFRNTHATLTTNFEKEVYCFSSVFAPAGLSTPIYHRWEAYSEEFRSWQTASIFSFPINGGRMSGYRGYSESPELSPGAWRCSVETERGALIGRTTFTVASGTPELVEGIL